MAKSAMDVFQKLGAQVETLWRDKNYSEAHFPAIAERVLREFDLPLKVSAWDTINWALGENYLPEQRDLTAAFGDPPLTLYNSPRFHIDIYFWLDGTTAIHQHGFCGAFQVLLGSSIHSEYDFKLREIVNMFVHLGEVNFENCELLKVGDVRQILPGREFIHGLFHLDQPSATVVVRTTLSPLHQPQFDYRKPFLAIDPFFVEPTTTKKLQSVSMLLRAKHPDADKTISNLLETADFHSTYTILSGIRHLLQNDPLKQLFEPAPAEDRYEKLFETVRKRHGALAETFPKVFAEQEKSAEIIQRRSYISDPEHRFFFALLLNVEGKGRIQSLVKERFPNADPVEKILEWVSALSQTKVLGQHHSNAIGIEGFDELDPFVLEDLLKNISIEEMRKNLLVEDQTQNVEKSLEDLENRVKKIQQSTILKPLLAD
jgi:hypothetical protein